MLRLSRQADYALLLLSLLARERPGATRAARDLAERSRVPAPMVAKVLKALVRAGLLTSTRGVHGGYALARPPASITVLDAIEATDGPVALTACTSASSNDPEELHRNCEQSPVCPVRGSWHVINDAIVQALRRVTLAEMTCPVGNPAMAFSGAVEGPPESGPDPDTRSV